MDYLPTPQKKNYCRKDQVAGSNDQTELLFFSREMRRQTQI
jgi:hypothetical protein